MKVETDNTFALLEKYRRALEKIATGDGYYGAMARDYKNIARETLGLKKV